MYTLMSWGKEKPVEPVRSCSHTCECLLGTKCDRLSINCSFEGKLLFLRWKWIEETSCHALLCLEKELSLEMLRRETMCSLCSASEERRRPPTPFGLVLCEDRCSLTGFFFWCTNLCTFKLRRLPSATPCCCIISCCSGWRSLRCHPVDHFAAWYCGQGGWRRGSGVEGRS